MEKKFKGYTLRINTITTNNNTKHKLLTVSSPTGTLIGSRSSAVETNTQMLSKGYGIVAKHSRRRR